MPRRLTALLALVAALAWSCLLFGIGLSDLTNDDTKPGVIFSIVTLAILIAALLYSIWRLGRPHLARLPLKR
jgi:membrane protein DedA with SNARE-associated domain